MHIYLANANMLWSNVNHKGGGEGECPGIMLRNVFCEQITAGGLSTVIEESMCSGEKPEAQKPCSDEDEDSTDGLTTPKVINSDYIGE